MSKKKRKTVSPVLQQQIARPPVTNQNPWKITILVFFVLVCASLILYGNSLSNQFVFDDLPIVVENPVIKSFTHIPLVLGLQTGQPIYRPVRFITYMVDYALSGLNPVAYHLSNAIYHAVTAFILFLVLRMLMRDVAVSLVGALLFLAHPVATDSVTYISGRRDILVTLFYLLAFYYFISYRTAPRKWHPAAIIGCFLLSLGSKEMAVTLPLICVLYDFVHTFMERQTLPGTVLTKITGSFTGMFTRYWKLYVPLGIVGAFFFYDKIFVHYPSLVKNFYGGSAVSNFATMVRIIFYYIKLILLPVVLHADYSYNAFPLSASFLEPRVIGAALIVGACIWFVLRSLQGRVWIFFGGMWFFITLLPVCQIFPHHELMAEHYLYLPLAGAVILFSPLWHYVLQRKSKSWVALIACILLLFSVRTVVRNRDWKDPMTLWASVVKAAPECARGHDNLGTEYLKIKDYKTALVHYQEAVRLRPEHAIFHNNLGRAYGVLGDIKNAEVELKQAVELNPALAEALNNLGIVYFQKADYTTAGWLFGLSSNRKPDGKVSFNLAKTYLKLGQVAEAIREFETTIRLQPDYTDAYRELALIFAGQGNKQESLRCLRKALEVERDAAKQQQFEAAIKKLEHGG